MLGETKDNPQTSGGLTSGLRFKLRWGENGVWCDCCLCTYEEYLKLNHAMSTKHTEIYSRKQAISISSTNKA